MPLGLFFREQAVRDPTLIMVAFLLGQFRQEREKVVV